MNVRTYIIYNSYMYVRHSPRPHFYSLLLQIHQQPSIHLILIPIKILLLDINIQKCKIIFLLAQCD